jgi:hypothetical protein
MIKFLSKNLRFLVGDFLNILNHKFVGLALSHKLVVNAHFPFLYVTFFFFINQLQHPRYINKNKQQQKEKGDVHQNLLNKKKQRDGD